MSLNFADDYRQDQNVKVLQEALQNLGYKVTPRTNELFEIKKGNKHKITLLQTIALNDIHVPYITIYKHDTKEFLKRVGVSVPKGWLVSNATDCLKRAKQLHYQCVIKPNSGSLGTGVVVKPSTPALVRRAFRDAQRADQEGLVVVEQLVPGKDLRIFALQGKMISALHREAANVVGDGQQTIKQLITQKNKVRLYKHLPLIHLKNLRKKLSLVPKVKEYVQLLPNSNISTGGDSYGVTAAVHSTYRKITEQVCTALQLNCVGFDWHVQDWTKPYNPQTDFILELNSSPDLYIHHWLWSGKPDPIAKQVAQALVG